MKHKAESIKTFNLPFISGVTVMSGRHILNDFRRHIHNSFIIGLVVEGKRDISFTDGTIQIAEGEAFILNPGQVHSCCTEGPQGHSYKVLCVSASQMQSIASQISEQHEGCPFFKEIHYKNKVLSEKLVALFETIEIPESNIQVESEIYSFLDYLLMNFSQFPSVAFQTGKQKDSIERVCNYLQQNFTKNISLKQLADVACLSRFHFQREFRNEIGITPHEYLNDLRIKESKKMLSHASGIADIALKLGFCDQSHFSRMFKKAVGVSPGKYGAGFKSGVD